jgi:hypothetical protein
MRNSLLIFKPPNQREDIIDKWRECDKDRDTTPTRLTTFRHTKRLPIRISRPSHKKFHFKSFTSKTVEFNLQCITNPEKSKICLNIKITKTFQFLSKDYQECYFFMNF